MTYTGPGIAITDAVFLYADARGSIVFSSDRGMTTPNVNTYDPYGNQGTTNTGRFQYTGQIWLEEAGLYYYKARVYSPVLGRFMQTDPIGYEDNVNLYAYVGNDPINLVDPTGLAACPDDPDEPCPEDVTAEDVAQLAETAGETLADIDGSDGLGNDAVRIGAKAAGLLGTALNISQRLEEGHSPLAAVIGGMVQTTTSATIVAGATTAGAAGTGGNPFAGAAAGVGAAVVDEELGVSEGAGDSAAEMTDTIIVTAQRLPDTVRSFIELRINGSNEYIRRRSGRRNGRPFYVRIRR